MYISRNKSHERINCSNVVLSSIVVDYKLIVRSLCEVSQMTKFKHKNPIHFLSLSFVQMYSREM